MLPADVIAEIIANLAAHNLQPSTATAVLGALAPLLRTTETPPPPALESPHKSFRGRGCDARASGRGTPRGADIIASPPARCAIARSPRSKPTPTQTRRSSPSWPRSVAAPLPMPRVSEARKAARRAARETSAPVTPRVPRERAQRFLREQLARGAKPASAVEDAAEKAHVERDRCPNETAGLPF